MLSKIVIFSSSLLWLTSNYLHAEVIFDGTLGPATELSAPNYEITSDLGQRVGTNLFHSFSHFNLAVGESANFSDSTGAAITNVISRVTGGYASTIDGLISSSIPNADVYFINPAGIVFGEGASINVPGSFHVSTADTLRLGEKGQFNAKSPEQTILSVAPPSAFGFLTDSPAPITLHDVALSVNSDQTLSLIGGDLTIDSDDAPKFDFAFNPYKARPPEVVEPVIIAGDSLLKSRAPGLYAEGGRLNLASVASAGEVTPTATGLEFSPNLRGGNITVNGLPMTVSAVTEGQKGGNLFIRGGRFELSNGGVLAETLGDEKGGNLEIRVDNLTVQDGGIISTSTKNVGDGGEAYITVSDTLSIVGTKEGDYPRNSGIYSSADGRGEQTAGNAGNIYLQARHLILTGGAQIGSGSFGSGNGGVVFIKADTVTIAGQYTDEYRSGIYGSSEGAREFYPSEQSGEGNADASSNSGKVGQEQSGGNQEGGNNLPPINADQGESTPIADEFDVVPPSTSNVLPNSGNQGGDVNEPVATGGSKDTANSSPTTPTDTNNSGGDLVPIPENEAEVPSVIPNTGNAGSVQITARSVLLEGGAISTDTKAAGKGGSVTINAQQLTLNHGAYIASGTLGSGPSGSIQIVAEELNLLEGGRIYGNSTSEADNAGAAGEVTIQANRVQLSPGSKINTSARRAAGGKVTLNVMETLYLQGGQITTSVMGGSERGGDIEIANPQFVILNHGMIRAQADAGQGGDIYIKSAHLLRSAESVVSASSKLGINGHILISSPNENVSGSLQNLPTSFFKDVSTLLNQICIPTMAGKPNTLVVIPLAGSLPTPQDLKASSSSRLVGLSTSLAKPPQSFSKPATLSSQHQTTDSNSLLALVGCARQRSEKL